MRIAMFTWESLHSISVGGVSVHVSELAAALERKGHEVHVFTRSPNEESGSHVIENVYYHYCTFDLNPSFVDEINNMCRSMVHRFFAVEDAMGHFDIIHAHDWLTSNACVWIKEGRHNKMILTIHSTEYGRCGNNFYNSSSERIRHHEEHGSYCADKVITVSNTLGREVQWIYHVPDWKVATVYNGVHPSHFDGWINPEGVRAQIHVGPMDPMVLFVGRMSVQKGPDLLVNSIPMILHYYPNAKFVFVGDGDQKNQCEQLAWNGGIAHAVRFLGYQNGQFLKDLFKACDVVAVPSRNEPFGIVVLEAWSAGKPVVATVNGGPSEFVWHGVNGYKVHDHPESIAWGLGTMLQDHEKARWMGRNGRESAVSAFSWDTIADQTLGVYHSVL